MAMCTLGATINLASLVEVTQGSSRLASQPLLRVSCQEKFPKYTLEPNKVLLSHAKARFSAGVTIAMACLASQ